MTILRMDNVAVVVDDLPAAVAFFTELGMEREGGTQVEGKWASDVVGVENLHSEIVMMRIPDAPGRIELTKYHRPDAITAQPSVLPPNTLGLHRVMFAVDDIRDTVSRLGAHGAELIADIANYENVYLLCYVRGPEGIIVGLAEQIGG